ncbi:hypothetical protein MPSEU_000678800 [Mayamaea pseudoterrestris]|nr:hypothetical protein MPSEU_000678800 [Mayamaea pseudoterrestris]
MGNLLLFRPTWLFPYSSETDHDIDATHAYAQDRHEKLVDKPLFVLCGGVLLSQVLAISCLILPMLRSQLLRDVQKNDVVAVDVNQSMSIAFLQMASLMSCLTGMAMTLAGSMLVVWDGNKGCDSTPLIVMGFLVVVCSITSGLSTLSGNDMSLHHTESARRSFRQQSASAASTTWREVSEDYATPTSRARRVIVDQQRGEPELYASPLVTNSSHQTERQAHQSSLASSSTSSMLPKAANAFRAVLPMVASTQPSMPQLPAIANIDKALALDVQHVAWDEHYVALAAFYEQHLHTKVIHGPLAKWLAKQRSDYRQLVFDVTRPFDCELNSDRIDLLNALHVNWNYDEATEWNNRYAQLRQHFQKHGSLGMSRRAKTIHEAPGSRHSRTSRSFTIWHVGDEALVDWMRLQQTEYFLWKAKQTTCMTIERILRLQALGFVWESADTDTLPNLPMEVVVNDDDEDISILV